MLTTKKSADANRVRGNELFKAKDYAGAIAAYSTAIGLDPKEPVFYSNRAVSYLKEKKTKKAETDFLEAYDLRKKRSLGGEPEFDKIYLNLLKIYQAQGSYVEWVRFYREWRERYPDSKVFADYAKTVMETNPDLIALMAESDDEDAHDDDVDSDVDSSPEGSDASLPDLASDNDEDDEPLVRKPPKRPAAARPARKAPAPALRPPPVAPPRRAAIQQDSASEDSDGPPPLETDDETEEDNAEDDNDDDDSEEERPDDSDDSDDGSDDGAKKNSVANAPIPENWYKNLEMDAENKKIEAAVAAAKESFKKAKTLSKSKRYSEAISTLQQSVHELNNYKDKSESALYNLIMAYKAMADENTRVGTYRRSAELLRKGKELAAEGRNKFKTMSVKFRKLAGILDRTIDTVNRSQEQLREKELQQLRERELKDAEQRQQRLLAAGPSGAIPSGAAAVGSPVPPPAVVYLPQPCCDGTGQCKESDAKIKASEERAEVRCTQGCSVFLHKSCWRRIKKSSIGKDPHCLAHHACSGVIHHDAVWIGRGERAVTHAPTEAPKRKAKCRSGGTIETDPSLDRKAADWTAGASVTQATSTPDVRADSAPSATSGLSGPGSGTGVTTGKPTASSVSAVPNSQTESNRRSAPAPSALYEFPPLMEYVCTTCGTEDLGSPEQLENHLKGKKHQKKERQLRLRRIEEEERMKREAQQKQKEDAEWRRREQEELVRREQAAERERKAREEEEARAAEREAAQTFPGFPKVWSRGQCKHYMRYGWCEDAHCQFAHPGLEPSAAPLNPQAQAYVPLKPRSASSSAPANQRPSPTAPQPMASSPTVTGPPTSTLRSGAGYYDTLNAVDQPPLAGIDRTASASPSKGPGPGYSQAPRTSGTAPRRPLRPPGFDSGPGPVPPTDPVPQQPHVEDSELNSLLNTLLIGPSPATGAALSPAPRVAPSSAAAASQSPAPRAAHSSTASRVLSPSSRASTGPLSHAAPPSEVSSLVADLDLQVPSVAPSPSVATTRASTPPTESSVVESSTSSAETDCKITVRIRNKDKTVWYAHECAICLIEMDAMPKTVIYPCGHWCTCAGCFYKKLEVKGPHSKNCDMCRTVCEKKDVELMTLDDWRLYVSVDSVE